jgi:serine/threonine-protein kinase
MPKRFGKYTLIRKLARGGMAEIFLALQRSVAGFEKLVVVKRILPHLAQDESFIQMLLSEARIAATLNHPNVAHIYDVGVFEGQYYIAMEHIHGEDLRSLIRQMKKKSVTAFPLEHALAIVLGCATGLAYAHEKQDLDGAPLHIVHRDVSPQNILVTFDGDVKLVDFGIAKASSVTGDETEHGQLKGKIPYMSPEQAQGRTLDARSDIFSLGVILFELTTGRRLFRGENEYDTLRRIVECQYPRPRKLNPELPEELEQIIDRALARDVSARYQTARDLQADLEDFVRRHRLAVSSLSLGRFMQELFGDKLDEQKEMLQQGRQLADVLAAQAEEDASRSSRASSEPTPERSSRPLGRTALALAGLVGLGSVLGLAWAFTASDDRAEQTVERDEPTMRAEPAAPRAARPSAVARVTTSPPGARIHLDGADTGKRTPATLRGLDPEAQHVVTLHRDGYVVESVPLALSEGEPAAVDIDLEASQPTPSKAALTLDVAPAEARATVDGKPVATTGVLELPPGPHEVEVRAGGYRTGRREIDLEPGEETTLRMQLERRKGRPRPPGDNGAAVAAKPGRLVFDSRPWCNVRIDGERVGQTPIVNHPLPAGRHRIECANPGTGSKTVSVTIRSGETTRQRVSLP